MASSSPTLPPATGWVDLVNESVHTSDDQDIGDIDAVSRNFIVIKRRYVNVHHYYVPVSKVEGWDGYVLWLKPTEEEVKRSYERNAPPDPTRYYVKDAPSYYTTKLEGPPVIIPRYTRSVFTTAVSGEQQRTFKCDLCGAQFRSEEESSGHAAQH